MSRRRQRRQPGLSMSQRRQRRVRRHRRFSVPGEVRRVGFLVDGGCRVWERLPRPGPPAFAFSPRRSAGPLPGRRQGRPAFYTDFCFGDPPAMRGQGWVPGLPGRGGPEWGRGGRGRSVGAELGAHRACSPHPPRSPALLRGGAWGRVSDYFRADARGDL